MRFFHIIFAEKSYINSFHWVHEFCLVQNFPSLKSLPLKVELNKFEKFTIVYIGSITERRGVVDLLDAVSDLQNSGLDVSLILIGKDNLKKSAKLTELIKIRDIKNIDYMGYLPLIEVQQIISKSHLGYAVLHRVPNYIDSYPTKIFEYMGCGIPFITSDFLS